MLYGSRRQIEGQYIFCNMISNELPLYYLITHHQLFSELIVIMCSSSLPYKVCQIICFHCNEKKSAVLLENSSEPNLLITD